MSESMQKGPLRPGRISLYEYIREELVLIMEGREKWERSEFMAAYDKAAARAMVRYARELGLEFI